MLNYTTSKIELNRGHTIDEMVRSLLDIKCNSNFLLANRSMKAEKK